MSLATRCPGCETLFRVSLSQLQVHKGLVRCGNCQHIFSGIKQLASADSEAWRSLNLGANETQQAPEEPAQVIKPKFLTEQHKSFFFAWPAIAHAPKYLKHCLMALTLTLFLQVLWWQRVNMAEQFPSLTRWIASSQPDVQWLFTKPASTLQVLGSALSRINTNGLQVDLTLFNNNRLPSKWPHIQIQLIDPQSNTLAIKTLKPSDYVKRSKVISDKAPPIAAGGTVEVVAFLNLTELNDHLPNTTATGFEIQLFDNSLDL